MPVITSSIRFLVATVRRCRLRLTLLLSALVFSQSLLAQTDVLVALQALARAHAAVVGIQTSVAEDARSAESLGRNRSGSGVVIGPEGLILTIGYLTLEAEQLQITTRDGTHTPGRLVAYDLATGFSLVQPVLPLPELLPVPLGDPRTLHPGDPLIAAYLDSDSNDAIGMSAARLVKRRAFSATWEYHLEDALFTSPPVPLHSGAALFNQGGELLGIGSLRLQNTGTESTPLAGNLFVPVDALKPILDEMRQYGSSKLSHRPWLGLTSSVQNGRVQLVGVGKDTPAQSAGLNSGDVILAVDGAKVATLESFYKTLWAHSEPSRPVKLTVLQGAEINTVLIDVVERLSTLRRPDGI